jgi:hypothetical protein
LLLLGRPECHLCEALADELRAQFGAERFELRYADVDSREDWQRRYGLKVPVLLDEFGEPLSAIRLDPARVQAMLDAAERG